MTFIRSLVYLCLVLSLLGCYTTGSNFRPPAPELIQLRITTPGQILASFGQPERVTPAERNGKRIDLFQYAHATAAGYATGKGPLSRTASFFFADGVLVGYSYTSSFPEDSTDFDESKAQTIVKGKATRADVEVLLGKPNGIRIFPLADGQDTTQLRYSYVGETGLMGTKGIVSKIATISIDGSNRVSDVNVSIRRE